MWGLPLVEGEVPVAVEAGRGSRTVEVVRQRALSLTLVALKGQGLSQHEVFAVADAWDLWDHLSIEENDFVLDPAPHRQDLVNHAWRFEGVQVLAWSLGMVRHLAFPDTVVDSGAITQLVVRSIAPGAPGSMSLRPRHELLDAADIAWRCRALVAAGAAGALHAGIVHERGVAFDWLASDA
jgi:hypothetical protein